MLTLIYSVTALAYGALVIWRISIGGVLKHASPIVLACLGMTIWACAHLSGRAEIAALGELVRSLAWLGYLASLTRGMKERPERWVLGSLVVLSGFVIVAAVATLVSLDVVGPEARPYWLIAAVFARLLLPIGGIIYLHNLYGDTEGTTSSGQRVAVISLAILWAYDLNLYTVTMLGFDVALALIDGRPILALLLAPAFAIAARRREQWKIAFSRKMTFQSLSLAAIGLYFVAMSLSARAMSFTNGATSVVLLAVAAAVFCIVAGSLLFMPTSRAWLKVIVTKHLFSHRYDYRTEWLRFSATIADTGESALALEERVVKAIAEVTESPSGLLLLPSGGDTYEIAASWRWPDRSLDRDAAVRLPLEIVQSLRQGLIAALGAVTPDEHLFDWTSEAWVAVPLIRLSSMIGLVILSKPRLQRELDWEDFDLLKAIGQQAAVHISDTHNQTELEEAKQFEEFNRRFSFIIHDIKNVVSQLSLLSSNAEVHGANPKFQIEMNRSLASAVDKMRRLLARLSPDRVLLAAPVEPIEVDALLDAIAAARVTQHPLIVRERCDVRAVGDLDKLKLALDHLVQNAIEASEADAPITLGARREASCCSIHVADNGAGMSTAFIRKGLFKPFVSTKGGGFGIGAAEAKTLVEGMGGVLRVSSIEGRGSTFTIQLPLEDTAS